MKNFYTLYDLLGISEEASEEEIKSSYRKLAKKFHPDRNKDIKNTDGLFIAICNAYEILSDIEKRLEYNSFLKNSKSLNNQRKRKKYQRENISLIDDTAFFSLENILSHINILLWDIELFIKDHSDKLDLIIEDLTLNKHLIKILTYIDAWILYPGGFHDYFMRARKKADLSIKEYIDFIDSGDELGHRPFYTLDSYYYDVRKRIDRFLNEAQKDLMYTTIVGTEISIFESIIEIQNFVIHYMTFLNKNISGEASGIPPYSFVNDCFI